MLFHNHLSCFLLGWAPRLVPSCGCLEIDPCKVRNRMGMRMKMGRRCELQRKWKVSPCLFREQNPNNREFSRVFGCEYLGILWLMARFFLEFYRDFEPSSCLDTFRIEFQNSTLSCNFHSHLTSRRSRIWISMLLYWFVLFRLSAVSIMYSSSNPQATSNTSQTNDTSQKFSSKLTSFSVPLNFYPNNIYGVQTVCGNIYVIQWKKSGFIFQLRIFWFEY